jgi:hypothetical protein
MTEPDISKSLEAARNALEEARLSERRMEEFAVDRDRLSREVTRGLELYNSMDVMRGAIEQCLDLRDSSAASILQTCLDAAINSLVVAFDFDIEDTWTICVYRAERRESNKAMLRCIAHARKISCDIADARAWPEGVGITGVAYSMGNEVVIPDTSAPELGTIFTLKTNTREHDRERYRSMVAVPIAIGAKSSPWGVAVVTTDRPHHFSTEPADGVPHAEPIRAIAAMAALAVKAVETRESRPAPPAGRTDQERNLGGDQAPLQDASSPKN